VTLELAGLLRFLETKHIARFKLPERLEVVDSLPLTTVGKVSKKDLREHIARRLAAETRPLTADDST
jgi:non-ribosomal peptide synthetase component E (peptide arylation enzyme)